MLALLREINPLNLYGGEFQG